MGTDIHVFVEYASDDGRQSFSSRPEKPAWCFGRFSLSRDYLLFDAIGDGRSSQMRREDVRRQSLYSPRGIPADVSRPVAWEYYDLVVESQSPYPMFWPAHGCVTASQAQDRVARGKSHEGTIAQAGDYGTTDPRIWRAVSKDCWHTPSWLTLAEILASLDHHRLPIAERQWDFRAVLRCLAEIEQAIGPGQVRMVFWFDS
jgi:hypothetical protein